MNRTKINTGGNADILSQASLATVSAQNHEHLALHNFGSVRPIGNATLHLNSKALSLSTVTWLERHQFLNRTHPITIEQIKELHKFAVNGNYKDDKAHKAEPDDRNCYPGSFRDGEYRGRPAFAIGVKADLIEQSVKDFVDWFNQSEQSTNFNRPEELAAEAMIRLIDIHPFWNGNGRTSRLLMNAILLRHEHQAIDTTLIDWHNPGLTGYRECLPQDAVFLAYLIDEATAGRNSHNYVRYMNTDGSKPRQLWADKLSEATPIEFLATFRDYIGAAFPSLRTTRESLEKVDLNGQQMKELMSILRAGRSKITHPIAAKDIDAIIQYFEVNELVPSSPETIS